MSSLNLSHPSLSQPLLPQTSQVSQISRHLNGSAAGAAGSGAAAAAPSWLLPLLAFLAIFVLVLLAGRRRAVPSERVDCVGCETVVATSAMPAGGGTKRAVLFGLNYVGTDYALSGCIDDVMNVRAALTSTLGFSDSNVTVYTDNTTTKPTRATILSAIQSLIAATHAGDTAFIWYSGHGTQVPSSSASDDGGYNEAWFPLDAYANGLIIDDTLRTLVAAAPSGSKVFVGSDSCHSGTMLDLRYMVGDLSARAVRTLHPNRVAAAVPVATETRKNNPHLHGQTAIPPPKSSPRKAPKRLRDAPPVTDRDLGLVMDPQYAATDAVVVCLSGSMDNQTSADAYEDGQPQGAMTFSFLDTLRRVGANISLTTLLSTVRATLVAHGYDQISDLSLGRDIDPTTVTLADVLA